MFSGAIASETAALAECNLFHGNFQAIQCLGSLRGIIQNCEAEVWDLTLHMRMNGVAADQPPFQGILLVASFSTEAVGNTCIVPKRHMTAAFSKSPRQWQADGYRRVTGLRQEFELVFHAWSRSSAPERSDVPSASFQQSLVQFQTTMRGPVTASIKANKFFLAFEENYSIFPDACQKTESDLARRQLKSLEALLASAGEEYVSEPSLRQSQSAHY